MMLQTGLYPFWFWNGKMEEREIIRQLDLFKSSQCKGIVIHCRVGYKIEYMSDRWLELFRFAALQARLRNLKVWIYDESGCPSGNAGEEVQRLRPDLYQKCMRFEYSGTDPQAPADHTFVPGSALRLDERTVPSGTQALRFFLEESRRHVDTFSREACDLFIKLTHQKYQEALGDLFGDPVEVVYTDDESWICCFRGLAWSPVLEREYQLESGCELSDLLPLLVEDIPGFEQARMDYRSFAERLFLKNFIQPQRDWCKANGLVYTGHLCGDEGPLSHMINQFGAPMPYLNLEDIPAIDDYICDLNNQRYLGQRSAGDADRYIKLNITISPLMIYKYASSVAHQFKNDWLSCECLTFLGWGCSTAYMDFQMNFEIGMGVNLFTPHAFYYTVGEVAKKDCPPSYFFQQPGFERFHEMFESWTHSAELLLRGRFHGDCLMLIPAGIWKYQRGNDILSGFVQQVCHNVYNTAQIEEALSIATFEMMRRHIGFDYGDERIVAAEAEIGNGRVWLGKCSYSTVILPVNIELLPEVETMLAEFQAQGGKVVSGSDLDNLDLDNLDADIDIYGDGIEEILVHARDNNGFRELYLVNLSGEDLYPNMNISGEFKLYNPRTKRAVKCINTLPDGMVFPAGMAAFILPETFECEVESFENSLFAPVSSGISADFIEAHPLNENIAVITADGIKEFHFQAGLCIDHVYTEQLGDMALQINDNPLQEAETLHHPVDPCYRGIAAADLFRLGNNHIDGIDKPFYLAGNFQVKSLNPLVFFSKTVELGDLTKQGYPCYWGKFEYNFNFDGFARFIELEMRGSAEVWINDHYVETNFAAVRRTAIAAFCSEGKNKLTLRLANTPQNFIDSEHPEFGIHNCSIIR